MEKFNNKKENKSKEFFIGYLFNEQSLDFTEKTKQ